MMRIAALTLAVSLLAPTLFAANIDGAWTASLDEKRPERLYVSLTRGSHFQNGNTMRVADFTGLADAQIRATTMTPVRFEMRREAGTAVFEGTFRNGKGAGQFDFTPNRSYIDAVRALGVEFKLDHKRHDRSDDEDLFMLALQDVSTAFIKTMINEGYKVSLEKYLAMRIFDITPEYIREMRSLGFKNLSSDDLVTTRIHRVTPQYVREMRAAGWDVSLDDLVASRIHGATPEFAAEMKKLGYGNLSLDDLVSFRIHGVTTAFIQELRTLGYNNVDADDLVSMRIHRVTPEFIKELEAAGYVKVPVDKLVSMRIHGIDAKFIKKMAE
jgi:predicted metallopeptidase